MRLRVIDGSGQRELVAPSGKPRVAVAGRARDEPWIIARAVQEQLGLRIAVLRLTGMDEIEAEWLDCTSCAPPPPMRWKEAPGGVEGPRAWWETPGWLIRTLAEADDCLAGVGLRRTGLPTQTRQNSVTGMLRIPTDDGAVWLKALPAMFAHEPRVVRVISDFEPESVPEVIVATPRWWLARELPSEAEGAWGDPLLTLAAIQLGSASRLAQLREAGCVSSPLADLPDAVAALANHCELAEPGIGAELQQLRPALERVCSGVDAVGIPDTVVHSDLTAANVRWTGGRWVVFDWTDATIGHPFAELGPPLVEERPEVGRRRAEAFAGAWRPVVSAEAVAIALAAAPTIAAAHQVVNYGKIYAGMEANGVDAASPGQMGGLLRFWASALVEAIAELEGIA
jgi:hypothetical protein